MSSIMASIRSKPLQIIIVLIIIVGLYGVVPQIGQFKGGLTTLRHLEWHWVALAIISFMSTYICAALTYRFLAFKSLPFKRTLRIEIASLFIGRLVPVGLGTLGAHFAYLRHQRHTSAQAAAVVGTNNVVGFAGHACIVVVTLIAFPHARQMLRAPQLAYSGMVIAGIVVGTITVLAVVVWLIRDRLMRAVRALAAPLATYRLRHTKLAKAVMSSIGLTLANIICFYACTRALQLDITPLAAVLVFSIGIGLGSSTPTPGGIGGTEAGLLTGLIATGVTSQAAFAVVVLYRVITYWVALAIGLVVFIDCQRRGWFHIDPVSRQI